MTDDIINALRQVAESWEQTGDKFWRRATGETADEELATLAEDVRNVVTANWAGKADAWAAAAKQLQDIITILEAEE